MLERNNLNDNLFGDGYQPVLDLEHFFPQNTNCCIVPFTEPLGCQFISLLSSGTYGRVGVYLLDDQVKEGLPPLAVTNLYHSEHSYVVIKMPKMPIITWEKKDSNKKRINGILYCDQNEKKIIQLLNQRAQEKEIEQRKFIYAIVHNSLIISELITYLPITPHQEKFSPSDLRHFMQLIIFTLSKSKPVLSDKQKNYFKRIFCEIINRMYEAQYQLHILGILHLDTAPRNFVLKSINANTDITISLKIIDFGLSQPFTETFSNFQYNINEEMILFDLTRLDNATLINFNQLVTNSTMKVSIYTDFFAMKATIIEIFGLFLGMESADIFGNVLEGNWEEAVVMMTDEERLTICLNNVEKKAQELKKNDSRGEIVQDLISLYNPYLTAIINNHQNDTVNNIIEEDKQKFSDFNYQCKTYLGNEPIDITVLSSILPDIPLNQNNQPDQQVLATEKVPTHFVFRNHSIFKKPPTATVVPSFVETSLSQSVMGLNNDH